MVKSISVNKQLIYILEKQKFFVIFSNSHFPFFVSTILVRYSSWSSVAQS